MTTGTRTVFEPRKTPVQARAAVTVDAISEATIQVLLSHGADRLTTRVADRAGVSVGTLYPYYPNKQSPLFAVMEDHFERVAAAVEASSEQAGHKPVSEIMIAAMSGAVRSLLEGRPSPATVRSQREQLVLLCQSYMAGATARVS